jgi:hypothetical protein
VLSIFARKAAGALGASGFPCALDLSRDDVDASLGRTSRREKAEMCFKLAPLKFESAHGTATNVCRHLRFAEDYRREIQLTCHAAGASLK